MKRLALFLPIAAAVFASACSTTPPRTPARALADDCDALRVELAFAQEDKRAAEEKRDGAWKVVVPFAVAGRYVAGKAQADAADRQLTELSSRVTGKGCAL